MVNRIGLRSDDHRQRQKSEGLYPITERHTILPGMQTNQDRKTEEQKRKQTVNGTKTKRGAELLV